MLTVVLPAGFCWSFFLKCQTFQDIDDDQVFFPDQDPVLRDLNGFFSGVVWVPGRLRTPLARWWIRHSMRHQGCLKAWGFWRSWRDSCCKLHLVRCLFCHVVAYMVLYGFYMFTSLLGHELNDLRVKRRVECEYLNHVKTMPNMTRLDFEIQEFLYFVGIVVGGVPSLPENSGRRISSLVLNVILSWYEMYAGLFAQSKRPSLHMAVPGTTCAGVTTSGWSCWSYQLNKPPGCEEVLNEPKFSRSGFLNQRLGGPDIKSFKYGFHCVSHVFFLNDSLV